MPQSTEKGFMTKEVTRRQFMKLSGKCLAGLALSTTMLNVLGTTQAEVDSGAVTTFALAQGLLVGLFGLKNVGYDRRFSRRSAYEGERVELVEIIRNRDRKSVV